MNAYLWIFGSLSLLAGVIVLFYANQRTASKRQRRAAQANARSRRSNGGAPRYRI